jgi:hypothetical protein
MQNAGRRGESCRRIHSPLFARDVATPRDHRIPQSSPHAVGANHAGEFIRPYSPDDTNHAGEFIRPYSPDDTNHAGECIRRYSPDDTNHAGECIRRYSPLMALFHDAHQKTHRRQMPPMRYGRPQSLAQALRHLIDEGALIPAIHEVGMEREDRTGRHRQGAHIGLSGVVDVHLDL